MNKYSPNWYWSQLGFSVERTGAKRTIKNSDGEIVCENSGFDVENSIAEWLYFGAIK